MRLTVLVSEVSRLITLANDVSNVAIPSVIIATVKYSCVYSAVTEIMRILMPPRISSGDL